MSEPARASEPPQQGKGGGLSKKYAGLPGWAWLGLAGVGAIAFWWWRSHQSSSAGTATNTVTGTDYSGQIATLQSEIQNMQGSQSSDTDVQRQWTPKVTSGHQTLHQLANANGTSPAGMFSWMRESPATEQQVRDFIEWYEHPNRKLNNLTYYVPASPATSSGTNATQAADTTTTDTPQASAGTGAAVASAQPATGSSAAKAAPKPRKAPKPPPRRKRK
jgi:hypothetical protein